MPQKKWPSFRHLSLAQEVERLQRWEKQPASQGALITHPPLTTPRTHPLPYPFNSIAGWKKIDERLAVWKEDSEKGKFRYHAIIWTWYETLRRLNLSREQQIRFAQDLYFLSEDAHDAFLGSEERIPMASEMPELPPDLKLAYAVQDGYPLKAKKHDQATLCLMIDTRYPGNVLKKLVALRIDEAKAGAESVYSQRGKSYPLARLIDALHVADEKERQKVKWSAAASVSETFPQCDLTVRGDKLSALYSKMTKTARQGIAPFFSAFF